MRKLLAMIMALAMILSMATTVFAADTYTITIKNKEEGHVYEAYQIFKGVLSNDADEDTVPGTDAILTDIEWGDSVANAAALGSAEEMAMALSNGTLTTQALIEKINKNEIQLSAPKGTSVFDENRYTIGNLPAGYYLIKDKDDPNSNVAYTEFILEVVEDSTVNPKGSVPQIEKKIKDINNSKELNMSGWQDSADHDVGDIIPYKLEATLADNMEIYKPAYNLVFHDYMSKGLTYKEITSAKIVNLDGTEIKLNENQYTVDYSNVEDIAETKNLVEKTKLTITVNDVKALGGKNGCKVIFEYNAELNTEAVYGAAGNPNEVYLEYSRNPYNGNDYGETPRDRVIAFTYKVIVNKVREDGTNADGTTKYAALSGATFELKKWIKGADDAEGNPTGEWKVLKTVETTPDTIFTFAGLDDGWYCLSETKAPTGYNSIDPIYFNVTAEHTKESNDPQLTMLTATETKKTGDALDTGDLGTFEVVHDLREGSLSTNIVNKAGIELPETGGIGTTIFYAAGALLVLCAVILLITKKRMTVSE